MEPIMKKFAFLGALALVAASAQAQLVTNGGFETGDFSGWTQFGDTSFTDIWDFDSHGGEFNAYFGPLQPGGIEQVIAASAGDQIQVSFWARSELGGTPNTLLAELDGQVFVAEFDLTEPDWTEYSAVITVNNDNPTLRFTIANPNDYTDLDDISATLVPAPGAAALLGLGTFMAARRRRN
jgi:hypothetical protein